MKFISCEVCGFNFDLDYKEIESHTIGNIAIMICVGCKKKDVIEGIIERRNNLAEVFNNQPKNNTSDYFLIEKSYREYRIKFKSVIMDNENMLKN